MNRNEDHLPTSERYVPLCVNAELIEASSPVHDSRGQGVSLICGRMVSSWSQLWLQECRDRDLKARSILRLDEKALRHVALSNYEADQSHLCQIYVIHTDAAAYGAEARRRLEATILTRWRAARAHLRETEPEPQS